MQTTKNSRIYIIDIHDFLLYVVATFICPIHFSEDHPEIKCPRIHPRRGSTAGRSPAADVTCHVPLLSEFHSFTFRHQFTTGPCTQHTLDITTAQLSLPAGAECSERGTRVLISHTLAACCGRTHRRRTSGTLYLPPATISHCYTDTGYSLDTVGHIDTVVPTLIQLS